MTTLDITQTDTTSLDTTVTNYSVDTKATDGVNAYGEETTWYNSNFTKWYGYYTSIPEIKKAIDAFCTWILGQGYDCDNRTKILLDNIRGWGEDTFLSILWNMLCMKKVNGDSFAEIVTHNGKPIIKGGIIVNLKPLDPSSIVTVCNRQGRVIRYEQTTKTEKGSTKIFQPNEILHLCNDRTADNIHGTSIIEACKNQIDIVNEAKSDLRRIMHRSTIRVLYVDEDDKSRMTNLKSDYAEAIKYGEVMILPGKASENAFQDLTPPAVDAYLSYIKYNEDVFYRAVGIPKVILGGTAENTEASAKVGVISWEPIFTKEITELEKDLFNQLGITIKIRKQPSLMDNMYSDEQKNTGQVGVQPSDVKMTANAMQGEGT